MYGRGTASVAEVLHTTTEEAQKIIDDFYEAYPGIKVFVEENQKLAKKRGFTETAWGRRRKLKHIQDEEYDFKYNNNRPIDFNPLLTVTSSINTEVPKETKDDYLQKIKDSKSNYTKNKIIEDAKAKGIDIISNQKFIADANRQVVNSIIQGR